MSDVLHNANAWIVGWVLWTLGYVMGVAVTYFFLYRPIRNLKNEYIAHLEQRLKEK